MKAEYLSRFRYVAFGSFERLPDGFALDLFQRQVRRTFESKALRRKS